MNKRCTGIIFSFSTLTFLLIMSFSSVLVQSEYTRMYSSPSIHPSLKRGFKVVTVELENWFYEEEEYVYNLNIKPLFRSKKIFEGNGSMPPLSFKNLSFPIPLYFFAFITLKTWHPDESDLSLHCWGIVLMGFTIPLLEPTS